jgi:hypothetical protein
LARWNLALRKGAYELALSQRVVLPPLVTVGARVAGLAEEGKTPAGFIYPVGIFFTPASTIPL